MHSYVLIISIFMFFATWYTCIYISICIMHNIYTYHLYRLNIHKTMLNSIPGWFFLEIGKVKLIWLYLALLFFRTCTLHHVQQIKKDMAHIFYQILCLWNLSCVIARMTNNLAKTHVYIFLQIYVVICIGSSCCWWK